MQLKDAGIPLSWMNIAIFEVSSIRNCIVLSCLRLLMHFLTKKILQISFIHKHFKNTISKHFSQMQTAHWLFTASKWLNPIQTHWCLIGFPASHTFCVGFQTTCILPNYDIEMFIWSKGNRMICVFLFNFVLFFSLSPKKM